MLAQQHALKVLAALSFIGGFACLAYWSASYLPQHAPLLLDKLKEHKQAFTSHVWKHATVSMPPTELPACNKTLLFAFCAFAVSFYGYTHAVLQPELLGSVQVLAYTLELVFGLKRMTVCGLPIHTL